MTVPRDPKTFADAMMRVGLAIGWPEVKRMAGRSSSLVRSWSQPDGTATPTIALALAYDAAYRAAGGDGAPFADAHAHLLGLAIDHADACQRALATDAADFAREAGEAVAATITASLPGASPRDHHRAAVEVQEVETRVKALARRLSSFLSNGAGPTSGKTGGPQ